MTKHNARKTVMTAQSHLTGWRNTVTARINARSDRGQTSVEYLGIIAVVVLIVAAILGTNIGQVIFQAITNQIAKVAG